MSNIPVALSKGDQFSIRSVL